MGTDGFTQTDMVDLLATITDQFPPDKSFEYLFDTSVHRFELINHLFREDKMVIQGGENIRRYVNYREQGTAQFVLPGKVYQPSISATLKKLVIPWRHAHGHWSVVDEEIFASRGPEEIIDLVVGRRQSAEMDLALLIEKQLFAAPDATSETTPLTIPYWIVPITTAQVAAATTLGGAFQGQNPTGFSSVAEIDASDSTYARWRNWNFDWSNSTGAWTDTDETRMGRMFRHLQFAPPMFITDLEKPAFRDKKIYINEATLESAELAAKAQNAQIGPSLGSFQGRTLFRGLPLIWIDALDTAAATVRGTNPVYMINWSFMAPVVRDGNFFRNRTFPAEKFQPDVTTTHIDVSYNLLSWNRQAVGGVGSYVA